MICTKNLKVVTMAAVMGLIFFAVSDFAGAAEEVAEEVISEEAPPEETLGPEEIMPTVEITPTGLIAFDFREAPLRDVLRLFAREVEINIVATPSVTGTVSMKLDNVKWRKALELILEVNKLKMTEDKENNIIKVMTDAEVAAEPLTTKIYDLNYLQAADYQVESVEYVEGKKEKKTKDLPGAATMLKPLLAENESIEVDAAGNNLIVTAIPATHDEIEAVVAELDKQTKQVLIEVKFIEASTEAGKELGIKWDFLREYGVEAFGPGTDEKRTRMGRGYTRERVRDESTSSSGSDERYLWEQIGRSGSVDRTLTRPIGGGLGSLDSSGLSSFSQDITHAAEMKAGTSGTWGDVSTVTKYATLSPDNIRLVLSALMEDSDAKLVSNPRISTVDNTAATIRAVKRWPVPRYTFNADTGSWEVQGFDYEPIGITLRVTPHINQDNFITLDVDPEVSSQVGTVIFGGGAGGTAEIPIIDSRSALTRVIVRSGETLVIGGLVKTEEVLKKSGVPLLKDIPVLGNIFKHTSKSTVNLDLMVFITPTIVEGPGAGVLAPPAGTSEEASPEGAAVAPAAPPKAE